jgi:flavin-binding protein dodecin
MGANRIHLDLNHGKERRTDMSESVYKIIELVGSSPTSWEEAAKQAVEKAAKTLKNLRIAEINKLDMRIEDGKVTAYRARVNISFKYQG